MHERAPRLSRGDELEAFKCRINAPALPRRRLLFWSHRKWTWSTPGLKRCQPLTGTRTWRIERRIQVASHPTCTSCASSHSPGVSKPPCVATSFRRFTVAGFTRSSSCFLPSAFRPAPERRPPCFDARG